MEGDKYAFKVWNSHRTNKRIILVPTSTENLYEQVILLANTKLQIDGSTLVLESDGTIIDEDELLTLFHKEIFILLEKNELWLPLVNHQSESSTSIPTTVTFSDVSSGPIFVSNYDDDGQEVPSSLSSVQLLELPETGVLLSNSVEQNTPETNVLELDSITFKNGQQNIIRNVSVNEETWRNFEIPWYKLPQDVLDKLKEGNRNKAMITQVVRMVVDEMRVIKQDVSEHTIRIIAHKMLLQYPKSFKDIDDDGEVLGDGSHTLFEKLKGRKNYLKQCLKRKFKEPATIAAKKKRISAAKAGCSHWEPLPSEQPKETIEEKIKMLNDLIDSDDVDEIKLHSLLEDTYAAQRSYLNAEDPPAINDVIKKWPALLDQKGIYWHYEKLVGHNINRLEESLKNKYSKIIEFGRKKNLYSSVLPNNEAGKCLEALKIVAKYFKEDIKLLIREVSNSNNEELAGPTDPSNDSPHIMVTLSDDGTVLNYNVVVENIKINRGSSSFFDALKECYAIFYNFNMAYPKKCSATMELIQRYLMKSHPDSGTKSTTFTASKKKVINLMKVLASTSNT